MSSHSQEPYIGDLTFNLVKVTESAALASSCWLGKGDKMAGDQFAVDAMRYVLSNLNLRGRIVVGEGEKDEAPMLNYKETVGCGEGVELDIAVDPLEGTNLLACGLPNAICVIGACPKGYMYDPGPSYYMSKLVVPSEAKNVVDIDAPVDSNLKNIAKALGKKVEELVVFVLDKPRHSELINSIRKVGARIELHRDGDVAGSLMAVDHRSSVDVMMGTGGTPEGVLSACAIKGLGGEIFARLDPQSSKEQEAIERAGINLKEVLTTNSLIKSDQVFFAATGVSGGNFLPGVKITKRTGITHSLAISASTKSLHYIETYHSIEHVRNTWDSCKK